MSESLTHDLFIAKLNNINSNFKIIASGILHGSLAGQVYLIFYLAIFSFPM